MKAKTVIELERAGGARGEMTPVGTEVAGPAAMVYCGMGIAAPADEECRAACEARGLTDARRAELLERYKRIASGRATGDPRFDAPDPQEGEVSNGSAQGRKRRGRKPETLAD